MDKTPVAEVKGLCKDYRITGENALFARVFPAVRDVGFQIFPGETFGIVGESGCGKSTVARLLMCLEKPTKGEVWFRGERVDTLPESKRRALRPRFQMVFQDSGSSLNPRKRVLDILAEPMAYHGIARGKAAEARVEELLSLVGLSAEMKRRYPHEFSGGQRQRVCIAKALSLNPELIVLDEPVSADSEPAAEFAGAVEPDLPLYRPRPGRGALREPPHRGHVHGPRGGNRAVGRAVRSPGAPLYPRPARRRADGGRIAARQAARIPPGRNRRSPAGRGLPALSPLPVPDGRLPVLFGRIAARSGAGANEPSILLL